MLIPGETLIGRGNGEAFHPGIGYASNLIKYVSYLRHVQIILDMCRTNINFPTLGSVGGWVF